MKIREGQRAYVSGAGSGIGRALSLALGRRGVAVAACDIRLDAAEETARLVAEAGGTATAYRVDVSDLESVRQVAEAVERDLGPLDMVFNNAGVAMHGVPIHQLEMDEWDWVIGVNLYGVIHGIKTFVPRLLTHPGPTHMVNTGSVAGFQVNPDFLTGAYSATKSAVVALSETLELELKGSNVGVSVLAPAAVNTGIHLSERSRPDRMGGPYIREQNHFLGDLIRDGTSPEEIARQVLDAVENDRFYIMTHPETRAWLGRRFSRILDSYPEAATLARSDQDRPTRN